jgi:hypothetical protein
VEECVVHEVLHAVDFQLGNTTWWKAYSNKRNRRGLLFGTPLLLTDLILPGSNLFQTMGQTLGAFNVCRAVAYPKRFSNHPQFLEALSRDLPTLKKNEHWLPWDFKYITLPYEAFAFSSLYFNDEESREIRALFKNVVEYINKNVYPVLAAE